MHFGCIGWTDWTGNAKAKERTRRRRVKGDEWRESRFEWTFCRGLGRGCPHHQRVIRAKPFPLSPSPLQYFYIQKAKLALPSTFPSQAERSNLLLLGSPAPNTHQNGPPALNSPIIRCAQQAKMRPIGLTDPGMRGIPLPSQCRLAHPSQSSNGQPS